MTPTPDLAETPVDRRGSPDPAELLDHRSPESAPATANPVESRNRQLREWHRTALAVTVVIIVLSFVLAVRDDQRVFVTGVPSLPLPEACGMRLFFQRDCPACGLTRSFVHLAHGNWHQSLAVHRLGWLLATVMLVQIPYRLIAIRNPAWTLSAYWTRVIVVLLVAMFLVNWLYAMFTLR